MSNRDLPHGAFITTLHGRRCTAVPRSDAPVAASTPTVAAPHVVANGDSDDNSDDNDDGGNNDNSGHNVGGFKALATANAADTPHAPDAGALGDTVAAAAAAASTANSVPHPGLDSSEPETSSQALPQHEDAIGQTRVQALDFSPPPISPSLLDPTLQALTQAGQPQESPSPSPSTDSPQPSLPTTESTLTDNSAVPTAQSGDNSAAPTAQSGEADDTGDQQLQQAPAPTPANLQGGGGGGDNPVVANSDVANSDVATSTIGLDVPAAAGDNQPTSGAISSGEPADGSGPATAVVAGSVAGGVAIVSVIAFLLWFWRKKAINRQRSSLLTPLTVAPGRNGSGGGGGQGRGEKAGYVIDRESLGPTPRGEKFSAAVGARFQRMRGKAPMGGDGPDPSAARDMRERNAAGAGSQPDFLTLLGMDDGEVRRETENRQAGHSNGGGTGPDYFLGGLGLNFDSPASATAAAGGPGLGGANPFSDLNALSHDPAKLMPPAVRGANPFSDNNAVRGSSNYVADVRRFRAGTGGTNGAAPPRAAVVDSLYRDSLQSEAGPPRPKFRSDPFDLERPGLLGPARQDLPASGSGGVAVDRPRRAHSRADSYSSKYSSGFSLGGDWGEPGPDVGPAAMRWDRPTEGYRAPGSVGQAM